MSTIKRAIAGYPSSIPLSATKNEAIASSSVALALAGRNRWLYEMLTGGPCDGEEVPAVPRNPLGTYGIDASGPPWGTAIKHPIMATGALIDSTNWDSWPRQAYPVSPYSKFEFDELVWVKPFAAQVEDTPYSRGYLVLVVDHNNGGGGGGTVNATLRIPAQRGIAEQTETIVCSTTRTVKEPTAYIALQPGENRVKFSVESDDETNLVRVWGLSMCQVAKRSH